MRNSLTWVTVVVLILTGWAGFAWPPSPRAGGNARGGEEKAERELKPEGQVKTPYVHTVVFYLKKDAPRDEVKNIIVDAHGLLARIPSVKGLWVGRPAEKATPELAVKDYHVSWVLLFEDYKGLQEYLEHKLHHQFREKHAKHAERVLVYDVVNQEK